MRRTLRVLSACVVGTTLVLISYMFHLGLAEQMSGFDTWPIWLRATWFVSRIFIFPIYIIPNLLGLVIAALFYSGLIWLVLAKVRLLQIQR